MKEQTFILPKGVRNFTKLMAFLSVLDVTKEVQVTIGPVKKERSNQQNKALWGCAYEHIRKATGNDKDELHEMFCGEYFGWEINEVLGQRKKRPKRTTTTGYDGKRDVISTIELKDFYAFVQQRAAEYSVYVPDPDPMWFLREEEARAA
jgi:hypothetical protein